jgi:acetyl esterase/lipase
MASSEHKQILSFFAAFPKMSFSRESVGVVRMLMEQMAAPALRGTRSIEVDADGCEGEWLLSEGADPDVRLLYLHGGIYVAGSRRTHRNLASRIGRAAGCAVLLIDYRLAPEHPHPAALDDALAAMRFMRSHGPSGRAPARRTFVAGDSAGGGLTLATLLALRDAGEPLPDGAVTLSAWTDLCATGESLRSRAELDPYLTGDQMDDWARLYLGDVDARHPLCSPLYGDLRGLPPLLIQAGDHEVLLDDSVRLADRARSAGLDVTLEVFPEMFHVFQAFAGKLPEGREAVEKIGAWMRARSV